jgi:hypothetical protein
MPVLLQNRLPLFKITGRPRPLVSLRPPGLRNINQKKTLWPAGRAVTPRGNTPACHGVVGRQDLAQSHQGEHTLLEDTGHAWHRGPIPVLQVVRPAVQVSQVGVPKGMSDLPQGHRALTNSHNPSQTTPGVREHEKQTQRSGGLTPLFTAGKLSPERREEMCAPGCKCLPGTTTRSISLILMTILTR